MKVHMPHAFVELEALASDLAEIGASLEAAVTEVKRAHSSTGAAAEAYAAAVSDADARLAACGARVAAVRRAIARAEGRGR